ncbi:uncharacterized protein [Procambarus clarkii]|uniref:uncharacterized protein n=1 Tax=Procambarus clarkii TaxID=6728 RepID=UPI001E678867|nr:uncharacterized protein LOC123745593 [Procambarus clarkii]XP_045582246.1 uncharacterized protein LOC123745593 [Procambarus clarkii]
MINLKISFVITRHAAKLPFCNTYKAPRIFLIQDLRGQQLHCRQYTIPCQRDFIPCLPKISVQERRLQQICSTKNTASKIQARTFFSPFRRNKIQNIGISDNVDSHYELIYTNDAISYIRLGVGGVNILGAGVGTMLCLNAFNVVNTNLEVIKNSPLEVSIFVSVNVLMIIGLFKLAHIYPFRIYYSELEDEFIAVFSGIHPFAVRTLKIKPGEVQLLSSNWTKPIIPWLSNIYGLPSQKIYLDVHRFIYPVYYNKLLGYC